MGNNLHILILCGSAQKNSLNLRVAKHVSAIVESSGNKATLIHLGQEELPGFKGYDQVYPERVKEILKLMMEVDGFAIVSPEYHHSVSSTLKNLFDYIDDETWVIEDRPIALISATSGRFGGVQGQWAIYGMLRTLRLWLVPDELYIPMASRVFLEDGNITDEGIKKRIENLLLRLIKVAQLLKQLRKELLPNVV